MKLRPFGSTGMMVSEIGLGAWQLANPDWGLSDRDDALRIVQASLDAGCNFFDTAPGYGAGVSETLLGEGLRGVRDKVYICTKFGWGTDGREEFTPEAMNRSIDESLRRLQTDYLDILLLHNPPRELMDGNNTDLYDALQRAQSAGRIREYGVSLDWKEEVDMVMETTGSRALEVFFNALYQEPLPAFVNASAKGAGLIIKVPLDSGWLSGRYRTAEQFKDVRSRWSPEVLERRLDLVEKFAALVPNDQPLAHSALQFCLAHREVSTVIPGPKSVEQTLDNFAAAERELPVESVEALHALWAREIEGDPLPW